MRAHDHHLIGYRVDGESRLIVLEAEDRECVERSVVRIEFHDVAAYQFRFANLVAILSDIRERPFRDALSALRGELEEGFRTCGWPEGFATPDAAMELAERDALRFFEITSAIGFAGWVIASTWVERDAA